MASTDELCRSFLDLWDHFDPGGVFAITLPTVGLARFDPTSVREHTAALRALVSAAEEISPGTLDLEIDRTVLLDPMRAVLYRLTEESPTTKHAGVWALALTRAVRSARLSADSGNRLALLEAVPGYLETARASLDRPIPAFSAAALQLLEGIGPDLIELAASLPIEAELGEALVARAGAAVAEFRASLEPEREAKVGEGTLGEAGTDRLLHYLYAEEATGARMLKTVARLVERLEEEVAVLARQLGPGSDWRDQLGALFEPTVEGPAWLALVEDALVRVQRELAAADDPAFAAVPVPRIRLGDSSAELGHPPIELMRHEGGIELVLSQHAGNPRLAELYAAQFGIPGQAFALATASRAGSVVRREFVNLGALAGFGLYGQELLIEAREGDIELRLLQRGLLLRQAVLAAADLGIHRGQRSPAVTTEQIRNRLGLSAAESARVVRGMLLAPLAEVSALAARQSLIGTWFGWLALHENQPAAEFRAAVLSYGVIPFPLARWGLGIDE